MKALILAAGRGSRLHPYTENCPKCLTTLGDISLIERQLATLRGGGVEETLIATGYRREQLAALPGVGEAHNPDWATTNMVESLFCAEDQFGDDLIVSYSDIVYEPKVLRTLLDSPHPVSVIVDRKWRDLWEARLEDPLSDAETLRLDEEGRITDIGNPPVTLEEIEGQYIGLMRFREEGVEALKKTRAALGSIRRPWMEKRPIEKAYMTDLLMEMILTGIEVHAAPIDGGWLEVDTVEDYETYAAMMADGSITRFFDPEAR